MEILLCRHCKSSNLAFSKHIGFGPKIGKVYHCKAHCKDCKKSYNIPRDKDAFKLTKDIPWSYSKNFKKFAAGRT